ncbi:ribonuclease P protein component [Spirochaeta africana]|uniref:Ribonuclease P protein component n=1 Tax=Spirochaeta africana (strain ATCC 700263 / DSM 8902 / Z-7692) TaxID=889378 RepID=H9UF23_SPIAZ|nr:ribonuclease P protein component [Spirochaeta africana DSM 8902]
MKRSLTKAEILRTRRDISNVFRRGKRIQCTGLKLFITPNQLEYTRILISPVRKFGTAVQRNRAKRQLREIFRLHKHRIESGRDIAVVLYPGTYSYADRLQEFCEALQSAGCITSDTAM